MWEKSEHLNVADIIGIRINQQKTHTTTNINAFQTCIFVVKFTAYLTTYVDCLEVPKNCSVVCSICTGLLHLHSSNWRTKSRLKYMGK